MENKRKSLSVVLALAAFLSILFLPTVFAAPQCTVNTPATSANITSSPYFLNATGITENSSVAIYNVTFYYETGGTYTTIATVQNISDNQSLFNNSWTWTALTDKNYDINATCRTAAVQGPKNVQSFASDENTAVGIDQTSPGFISVSATDRLSRGGKQTITAKVNDSGFSDGVSTCTLNLKTEGKSSVSMTDDGYDVFSYSYYPIAIGINEFTISCTDAHNYAKSSGTKTFYIASADDDAMPAVIAVQRRAAENKIQLYAVAALVVVVMMYMYFRER